MNDKKKNWFARHKVLTIILAFIVIVAISAGASGSNESTGGSTSTNASTKTEDKSENDEKDVADSLKVGDPVTMGSLTHVLHGVRWDPGEEFMQPEEGKKYLVVDIELKNNSDKSESLSTMLMWKLLDSENRSADMAIGAKTNGSLDGELGPKRTLRGEIAYSVPNGQEKYELIFEPNIFGFGQAIYTINAADIK